METSSKLKIIKRIIITVIIAISTIIVVVFIVAKNSYRPKIEVQNQSQPEPKEIEEVTTDKTFYRITEFINQYLDKLDKSKYVMRDGSSNFSDTEETRKSIYNLLSQEYIEKNKITIENLYEHVYDFNTKVTFIPLEMYVNEQFGVNKYIVYGETIKALEDNKESAKMYIIVNVDEINKTFSVEQLNEQYNDLEEIDSENNLKEIKANEDNTFVTKIFSEEEIAIQKYTNFKLLNQADSRLIYDKHLDTQYKKERFPTYEDYLNYLTISKERFLTGDLYQYSSNKEGNTIQNVFTDINGATYKFTQTKSSDYTVLLDGYTVVSEETKKEYMSKTDKQKVQANISKWIQMINNKDYIAAYNVLDETFRNNKFKNIEAFAEEAKQVFTTAYTVDNKGTFNNFTEENGVYIQKIKLKNKINEEEAGRTANIIMQLGEGLDFVMSFEFTIEDFE